MACSGVGGREECGDRTKDLEWVGRGSVGDCGVIGCGWCGLQ